MKNKESKIIFTIIMIVMVCTILTKPLNNLDEIWNYSFAKNIAEGMLPYKDFNMILTPLLPIINSYVLKILGNELISIRIISIIVNSIFLFLIFKILKLLKIKKEYIYLTLVAIYLLFYEQFILDYNVVVTIIYLFILYLELQKNNEILELNVKKDFWIGMLVGTSILFKQSTGIILSITYIFYKMLNITKKEDIKEYFKIVFVRFLGVSIPVIILYLYLIKNNILLDFLDYAVYGIKTFENKVSYIRLIKSGNIFIVVLSILIPITIIYSIIKLIKCKNKTEYANNMYICLIYGISSFLGIYPIADKFHFLYSSIILMILLIYIITQNIGEKIKDTYLKAFVSLGITYLTIFEIAIIIFFNTEMPKSQLNHFRHISSKIDEKLIKIDEFISEKNEEGKKVYILDSEASVFMIPLDKYNKDYDLFLKGNLGEKGEYGQIENLKKEEKVIVLIKNDKVSRNWQNPEKVRKYIIENWSKIGEIEEFYIYEKE